MTRYELVTEPPTLLWVTALSSQSAKSDTYLEIFFNLLKVSSRNLWDNFITDFKP